MDVILISRPRVRNIPGGPGFGAGTTISASGDPLPNGSPAEGPRESGRSAPGAHERCGSCREINKPADVCRIRRHPLVFHRTPNTEFRRGPAKQPIRLSTVRPLFFPRSMPPEAEFSFFHSHGLAAHVWIFRPLMERRLFPVRLPPASQQRPFHASLKYGQLL